MRKSNKRRIRRRRTVKEQVRDIQVQGLPNPGELASKISSSGSSAEEIMGWLGAVLSRAGMAPSAGVEAEVEVAEELPPEPPAPTPSAVEEQMENDLLDALLREIKRRPRSKRSVRRRR